MADLILDSVVEFQGGGIYDSNGQLMRAGRLTDGNYIFVDVSRYLDGIVEPSPYPHEMVEHVKWAYLRDDYSNADCRNEYREALRTLETWRG